MEVDSVQEGQPGGVKLVERRGAGNLIAGVVGLACAFAAVRGAGSSPVAATIFGGLAVAVLVIWVVWRMKPASQLEIAPAVIELRRGDSVVARWEHPADRQLRLTRSRAGTFLALPSQDKAVINLMGFDLKVVARACVDNGWTIQR